MNALDNRLKTKPVVYVTRDIERASGFDLASKGFFIIANYSPFAKQLADGRNNVLLVKGPKILDTWQLLQHQQTKKFIDKIPETSLLVFKNTSQIEKICRQQGWPLLNNPASLSNTIEEKISQIDWAGPLKKYFPKYQLKLCQNIVWQNQPFILQFNRSHTGSGTILIRNQHQLEEIKTKFPQRQARIADYVDGPLFTSNNLVWGNKILVGNISYQITGLPPFTDLEFATVGNDWALPRKVLSEKQSKQYQKITTEVGKKLKKDGWRGLFGIDIVAENNTGKLYLVEINARQPASTSFESQLQMKKRHFPTTFEAHLASLLGIKPDKETKLVEIDDGAQVIDRVKAVQSAKLKVQNKDFEKLGLQIIKYNNKKVGADRLRIQSDQGIMAEHNKFNELGNQIKKLVS